MSIILDQAKRLPVPERMKLAQEIWDSIEAEQETVELSPEQRAELEPASKISDEIQAAAFLGKRSEMKLSLAVPDEGAP